MIRRWLRKIFRYGQAHDDQAHAHVVLSKSGQLTARPHVHVSVQSRRGAAGIMTEPDTEQGNAKVEMYGRTYAHILGIPLIDRRE